jgi:hypothetical protein
MDARPLPGRHQRNGRQARVLPLGTANARPTSPVAISHVPFRPGLRWPSTSRRTWSRRCPGAAGVCTREPPWSIPGTCGVAPCRHLMRRSPMVVVRYARRPAEDVAFIGGIDLDHGSRDDADHRGDRRASAQTPSSAPTPPITTCSSSCADRWCGTRRRSSANGGRTRRLLVDCPGTWFPAGSTGCDAWGRRYDLPCPTRPLRAVQLLRTYQVVDARLGADRRRARLRTRSARAERSGRPG